MTTDLDNAQINADGNPECGDEYCPGLADCPTCRRLRDADRQRYETAGDVIDVVVNATDLNIVFPKTVTTAQLVENTRARIAAYPNAMARAEAYAQYIVREMPRRFPHLDPADLAAVLLHAATLAGSSVLVECHANEQEAGPYGLLGPNMLAVAGERLHAAAEQAATHPARIDADRNDDTQTTEERL